MNQTMDQLKWKTLHFTQHPPHSVLFVKCVENCISHPLTSIRSNNNQLNIHNIKVGRSKKKNKIIINKVSHVSAFLILCHSLRYVSVSLFSFSISLVSFAKNCASEFILKMWFLYWIKLMENQLFAFIRIEFF